MRLAFLCGAVEPGRDGVGDYSRRLAGELIRQGYAAVIVGSNDPYVSKTTMEQQEIEGTPVSVLRLPDAAPWGDRAREARKWLEAFNPDWISLQFVPFGFHPKGLPFGFGKFLMSINTQASWHVMFHELWLGLGENSTVKHRGLGLLQRYIILDFMRRLRPGVVHTQAEPYQMALRQTNIAASIMPLFGNIPPVNATGWDGLLEPLVTKASGKPPDRDKFFLAGVLGMVHPEWNAEQAVDLMHPLTEYFQKRLVLVFIGKNGLTPEAIKNLKLALHGRADVIVTGERPAVEISKMLQTLDFGLATSPRQIIQKSGSVAAMQEHGLKVLVTRDDWRLRGTDAPPEETSPWRLTPKQFSLLKTLPARDPKPPGKSGVQQVAGQLLESLSRLHL
ncbi:MAG: hypothetical protein P4N60_05540 [Verrucomicrobiae bacterium]|nr:hypothetical protein [Verrucomicrobiae bacterium]